MDFSSTRPITLVSPGFSKAAMLLAALLLSDHLSLNFSPFIIHHSPRGSHRMSSLWIINKAGGLIYQSEHFVHPNASSMPNNGRLSSNEYLVLAGTLHGIHAITAKLNPVPNRTCSGIESLDSDHFTIRVMVTSTGKLTGTSPPDKVSKGQRRKKELTLSMRVRQKGTKFVLVTSPAHPNPAGVLHRCYEAYADHVIKNPFYTPEMPVRVETFDRAIETLVKA